MPVVRDFVPPRPDHGIQGRVGDGEFACAMLWWPQRSDRYPSNTTCCRRAHGTNTKDLRCLQIMLPSGKHNRGYAWSSPSRTPASEIYAAAGPISSASMVLKWPGKYVVGFPCWQLPHRLPIFRLTPRSHSHISMGRVCSPWRLAPTISSGFGRLCQKGGSSATFRPSWKYLSSDRPRFPPPGEEATDRINPEVRLHTRPCLPAGRFNPRIS